MPRDADRGGDRAGSGAGRTRRPRGRPEHHLGQVPYPPCRLVARKPCARSFRARPPRPEPPCTCRKGSNASSLFPPPQFERLFQSPLLEATFGGGEANVAVSLARFGMDAAFVTVLPTNPIGEAALAELRRQNVDTSLIVRRGERLGIYFLETGTNQRPAIVIYDRSHSSMAEAGPDNSRSWCAVLGGSR